MQNLDADVKVSSLARRRLVLQETLHDSPKHGFITYESRRACYNTRRKELAESLTERAVQDAFNLILIGNYKERVIGGTFTRYLSLAPVLETPIAEMLNPVLQYASIWTGTWSSLTSRSSAPPFIDCCVSRPPYAVFPRVQRCLSSFLCRPATLSCIFLCCDWPVGMQDIHQR